MAVAQLAERRVVVSEVAGSSPVSHPPLHRTAVVRELSTADLIEVADRIDISPISGFPEWSPGERIAELELMDTIRSNFELYGFAPIETPAVERMSVLTAKGGLQRQIYSVQKPAVEEGSGTELGLHFDLTVPLARYVAQRSQELSFPFRRYQMQKVWRGERAQRGRFREFYQCDIDIIGSESLDLLHDAEVARVISAVFDGLGIPEFRVHLSNRKVLTELLRSHSVGATDIDEVLRLVDKAGPTGAEAVRAEIEGAGYSPPLASDVAALLDADHLIAARDILADRGADPIGVDELSAVHDAARTLGTPPERLKIDLGIARGLDYYTGTVYETFISGHESWGSVCSGGRYDDLAGFFTKRKLPGVGVSIGLSRLFNVLRDSGIVECSRATPATVLITMQDRTNHLAAYLALAAQLRASGIATEVYLQDRRLRDQLSYASSVRIPLVVIAGASEFENATVTLRDMATGTQREVPTTALIEAIQGAG